jgi:hypothetical protein
MLGTEDLFPGGDEWHAYRAGWVLVLGQSHQAPKILEGLGKAYWMEAEAVMTRLQDGADRRSREGVRRVAGIERAALPGAALIRVSDGGDLDS